jgi:hypothetical protein
MVLGLMAEPAASADPPTNRPAPARAPVASKDCKIERRLARDWAGSTNKLISFPDLLPRIYALE